MTAVRLIFVIPMMLATALSDAWADDWPQWRGPRRDGVSAETGLLRSWPEGGPKVVWKSSGVGTGYASVAVHRGRVFTIGKHGADVVAIALDAATGNLAWSRKIGTTSLVPSSTPTVDDDRLYALGPDGDLACLNSATGEILWQKSFSKDFAGRMPGRGYGESPFVDGPKLICTPGGADAALVALDKRTGAVLWKSKMPNIGPAGRDGAAFASIVVSEAAGVRQYVQFMGRGVVGFDAKDGRFLWGYNDIANGTANIPTPIVRDDLVFAANGYNTGSVLLRLLPEGKQGGVKAEVVYALNGAKFQNHHGGVVLVGDHLYGGHGSNNGLPTCLELQTGRVVWKRRGPGEGSAAVVCAEGLLYFRYQNGIVALIEASAAGYQVHGTLQIPGAGGDSWSHPVVANGRLYLREQDDLWVHNLRRDTTKVPADPTTPLPVLDAAVVDLRNLDVSALPLSAVKSAKARRLYEYTAGADKTSPAVMVILADKHLAAQGTVREEVLYHLKKLRLPVVLNLAGTSVSDAGLKQFRDLSRVVGIDLELCSRVSDAGLESLRQFEQMRVLILAGTSVSVTGIRHLTPNKSLTALDLDVCDGITDVACEALAEMRQLKALLVKKTGFETRQITDAGLRHLSKLPDLEVLNLYGNLVTDAGLAHLQELSKLRELDLSLLAITDRGLAHLKPLRTLERLDLLYSVGFAGPIVTNAGLESVSQLSNLSALNLTGARLTDAGLESLQSLKKLKTLQVVKTSVSADGIRAFKAAVPDCVIIK